MAYNKKVLIYVGLSVIVLTGGFLIYKYFKKGSEGKITPVPEPLPKPENVPEKVLPVKDASKYENIESEIENLKKLNAEDRLKLQRLELEIENLKNLNKSHVNTINQLSSELNTIRLKDQELINSQLTTINQLSSELNTVRSKNIFNQTQSNDENVVVDVPMKMLNIKESSKVSKMDDIESDSHVLSKRLAELESTIKELEELNNSHVNTIKKLNSELSNLRSNDSANEVILLRKKVEELNLYNQQILVHNNNLARRLMQIQSRY
jgi:DNA repair exonuclease SbcCD ATPase subunit